ncbi:MAG: hypothetical protein AAF587_20960 [Bacteroidota bacterium]
MAYARARLVLGIVTVSFWILLAGVAFLQGVPAKIGSLVEGTGTFWTLGLFLGGYVLISFPFDWFGGHRLPVLHGRSHESFGKWGLKWLRGAGIHMIYLWISGYMILVMAGWLGILGALLWVGIQMLLLTGFQIYMAIAIAPLPMDQSSHRGRFVYYVNSVDKSFTGGIHGMPGVEGIVMPVYWKEKFSEKIMEVLLARRHGAINSGSHGRGILLAIGVNAALFAAAAYLSPLPLDTVGGLISTSLLFTLFSAVSMLGLLPWLSRTAILEIDRWVYFKKIDGDDLRASIEATQRLQNDMRPLLGKMSSLLLSFPTKEMRLSHLQTQKALKGAWQANRHNVYTSWAGLNLLSRAMPYHIGKPELWVFLPGD